MNPFHRWTFPVRSSGLLLLAMLLSLAPANLRAANPEDTVVLDANSREIDVINSQGATGGTRTVVASASVGSGVTFNTSVLLAAVSPRQQLYYWDPIAFSFVSIDLTNASYPRTSVVQPTATALRPFLVQTGFPNVTWDFANNAIVYADFGSNGNASNGSTSVRGIYRLTPSTAAGTPSTNVLLATFDTNTRVDGLAVTQDGTVYALLDNFNLNAALVVRVNPGTNSFTRVDGGAAATPAFQTIFGISWDFRNQRILVFDQALSQAAAKIISLDPATGTRTLLSSGSTSSGAYGGTYIQGPATGFRNTANRIIYTDYDAATFSKVQLSTVNAGSPTASQYYTGATATSTNGQFGGTANVITYIPPSAPVITSPTATSGAAGTTATLGANVVSPGTALVAPTVQTRGVVYALTSANSNPRIGGTGVTNVASTAGTGVFTVSASGLTSGANYSYAGYVSTYYGTVYTSVGTFVTATTPTVTSPTVTAITGTSATLGGNVTADGNATLSARGVVISTTANNNNPIIGQTGVTNVVASTTSTGVFTVSATGLTAGTSYTYRAYATNSVGTSYTTASTFTTLARPTANNQSVSVPFNTATAITLTGSDPNTPAQTLTYALTSPPSRGTLSGTAPNLTYTPNNGSSGADSFQFTTTTTAGGTSAPATVNLNVAVGTPTANSQSVSVPFNTATAITLTGTDPDVPALPLTYTVLTAPARGTLSGTAPNLTYTPSANTQGADSFTFRVSNGTNTSNTATVSITVAAGTPTANAQSVTTAFNTARAITLSGTDPNGPALSLTYTVATAPTKGTLSGTAPNLTYTPTANYQGADSFTFTVSNGQKTSSAATVSITVAPGTPTANSQSVSTGFNTATAITLTGTDPDVPALPLTYTVLTAPARGTLSGTAPNLTYTPSANTQGADSFTFRVSNGTNTSNTATVSITVAPGTPTANSQSVTAYLNTAKTITLTGTDPDVPALSLTYTVLTAPANGTLSGTAPNLTYTPATGFSGADSFTFRVSNGTNASNTATVGITVIGQPLITGFNPASGPVGTTVTITGSGFTGATGVTFFRNVASASVTVISDTQLRAVVPTGATTGALRVNTPSGSNTTSTKFQVVSGREYSIPPSNTKGQN